MARVISRSQAVRCKPNSILRPRRGARRETSCVFLTAKNESIASSYRSRIFSVLRTTVRRGSNRRNMETENSSCPLGSLKIDRAVVPLQDLIGLRQPDAAAVFLGSEIELEDLVAHVDRDSHALVANLGNHQ